MTSEHVDLRSVQFSLDDPPPLKMLVERHFDASNKMVERHFDASNKMFERHFDASSKMVERHFNLSTYESRWDWKSSHGQVSTPDRCNNNLVHNAIMADWVPQVGVITVLLCCQLHSNITYMVTGLYVESQLWLVSWQTLMYVLKNWIWLTIHHKTRKH